MRKWDENNDTNGLSACGQEHIPGSGFLLIIIRVQRPPHRFIWLWWTTTQGGVHSGFVYSCPHGFQALQTVGMLPGTHARHRHMGYAASALLLSSRTLNLSHLRSCRPGQRYNRSWLISVAAMAGLGGDRTNLSVPA